MERRRSIARRTGRAKERVLPDQVKVEVEDLAGERAELDQAVAPPGPPRPSLVRAMRLRGSEAQLARALATVCQDGEVARELVRILLDLAARGRPRQAGRLLERLPHRLACVHEVHGDTVAGRDRARRQPGLDAVDLLFAGPDGDFRLCAEIKLGAQAADDPRFWAQIDRYVEARWPVVALVRDPDGLPEPERGKWLGALAWSELEPRLAELEVRPPALAEQWRDLLAVMREDGEFLRAPPSTSREVAAAVEWLDRRRDALEAGFRRSIAAEWRNGEGREEFSEGVRALPPTAGRGRAYLQFALPPTGGTWVWVGLRGLGSPAPAVHWAAPPSARAHDPNRFAKAHRRLRHSAFVAGPGGEIYGNTVPLVADRAADDARDELLFAAIAARLDAIAQSGVLAEDVAASAGP
jgi:hypothetical protein